MTNSKKSPKSEYSRKVYFKTKRIREWADEFDKGATPDRINHLHEALSEARGLVMLLEQDISRVALQAGDGYDMYPSPAPQTNGQVLR